MAKLKASVSLETAFGEYTVDEILGEGGAGRVYGGKSADGERVAIKLLTQSSTDKKRRFKNEIAFLAKNRHANLVPVTDHGLATSEALRGPFYVMPRYEGNLRQVMSQGIPPAKVMSLFSQILDGVEVAHLLKVTHRDLKPENVLMSDGGTRLAIADFGVASFTADQAATLVETAPTQRLANFQYAAPEQRTPGTSVAIPADIFALGLILNEMFTGAVPHGNSYKSITSVSAQHAYLDAIVTQMTKQAPTERPQSIQQVKTEIQKSHAEAVALQRLSAITATVIPAGEIDDPLAHEPPRLVGVEWDNGLLTLTLDREINPRWSETLKYKLGNYTSAMGNGPETFRFDGKRAFTSVDAHSAQSVVDYFKSWLPRATAVYKYELESEAQKHEADRKAQLHRQRVALEQKLAVNSNLRI